MPENCLLEARTGFPLILGVLEMNFRLRKSDNLAYSIYCNVKLSNGDNPS